MSLVFLILFTKPLSLLLVRLYILWRQLKCKGPVFWGPSWQRSKENALRIKRKKRVRGSIFGTAEKPRVSIFKSNKYVSAQAINDVEGVTLAAVSSKAMGLNVNKENAIKVAAQLAENLKAAGIEKVVYDRNGYLYHGVVAAFADALSDNGIKL